MARSLDRTQAPRSSIPGRPVASSAGRVRPERTLRGARTCRAARAPSSFWNPVRDEAPAGESGRARMGLLGDIVHTVTSPVSDAWHATTHAFSSAAGWIGDRASDFGGWVGDEASSFAGWVSSHWKSIAVIAVAVVAGTVVTVLTGGAGAPLLVALAAGGFAGGASGSIASSLLNGKSINVLNVLKAGAISGAISVGTFGLGKFATPLVSRLLGAGATRAIATAADALPGVDAAAGTEASTAGTTLADLDP